MNSRLSFRSLGLITLVLFLVAAAAPGQPDQSQTSFIGPRSAEATTSQSISLDVRDADIRDVLSALAIKMDVGIILIADPCKVSFRTSSSPLQALELLLQSQGLAYIQEGDLIVVGEPEKLQDNFFKQLLLTRFDLFFIPAGEIQTLAEGLGIPLTSITLDPNQNVIWAQGPPPALHKLQELINTVDSPISDLSLDYKTITLTQISPKRAIEILDSAGIKPKQYLLLKNRLFVFDTRVFARWAQVETLIREVDTQDGRDNSVFVHQLKNITAKDAEGRLAGFGLTVQTATFNYPEYTQELLVICPPYLESQVRSALISMDGVRKKIRVPVVKATGTAAHAALNAKRSLLSELSGVPVGNMFISRNLSGDTDSPRHVLWVEDTPEKVAQIEELIKRMQSLGTGQ
ncbi:MAG: energy transducer TonB [Eubacteriales bacterium]|nr:energy transducer TonB [Eubacteriales bacterium]MDZ4042470.1 energy transducer TonB [Eubacteriales bacterium]MDZ7610578.1 energy transducer TonB [Eubacteriales bacterium]